MKKNIKLFSIMLGCMTVLMMSSCLSSSSNNDQTDWEEWVKDVRTELTASHGSYAGQLYFEDADQKIDSVAASWVIINDSTVELSDVPVELLLNYLPESERSLKEELKGHLLVDVMVKMYYNIYYKSPLLFYLYPEQVKLSRVTENGNTVPVVINFCTSESEESCYGQYLMSTNRSLMKMFLESVYVGDKQVAMYRTNRPYFYWLGKKK